MRSKRNWWIGLLAVLVVLFIFSLPDPLFDRPLSTILYDSEGRVLSARLADDEQWRFPPADSIPSNLEACILQFEDKRFHSHLGVDILALGRAVFQNIRSGRIVSGASTISMQVIRLSGDKPKRNIANKLKEMWQAMRLEFRYSKEEILQLYCTHAPYGGNVVGIEAASWRYFRRPLHQLSWAESATLAVLPNAPASMHPGKSRDQLLIKRNKLLLHLLEEEIIDSLTYDLALDEELPQAPSPLPHKADHALSFLMNMGGKEQRITSTISEPLQLRCQQVLDRYVSRISENGVKNAAAIIVDLETGEVLSYVGNSSLVGTLSPYVDLVQAGRSSGSILKPFLYARAIENGMIHNQTLLRDAPLRIDKFSPQNFSGQYLGLVRAEDALASSLNIPATKLLQEYGVGNFLGDLQQMNFRHMNRGADDYGLSLILGGGEVSLWDLARNYSKGAASLSHYQWSKLSLSETYGDPADETFNIGAWWQISEALTQVERPELHSHWKSFASGRRIAWKTGTSQGFRDAWSVGFDKKKLVAVWVGNADGEGRPGLTGASVAGPLMFELFEILPPSKQWERPDAWVTTIDLCPASGLIPGPDCPVESFDIMKGSKLEQVCHRHERALLNSEGERVQRNCAPPPYVDSVSFEVSPVENYYFRPPSEPYFAHFQWSSNCTPQSLGSGLGFIYPNWRTDIVIPINLFGQKEKVILKATHLNADAEVFWYIDESYIGQTKGAHQVQVDIPPGEHQLLLVDDKGQSIGLPFKAIVDQREGD